MNVNDAINEMIGDYWLCAGCGQWKRGMAAAHNFSGPVCYMCEETMTRDQAEEIWMANQVGMFYGPASQLARAVLILSQLH